MRGKELEDHRVEFKCEVVRESDCPSDSKVVTINPFVPSRYDSDSHDGVGSFTTMTLLLVLGEKAFRDFQNDRGEARGLIDDVWPSVSIAYEYFMQQNWEMFNRTVSAKLGLEAVGQTTHQRTTIAYQAVGMVTIGTVGSMGDGGARLIGRYHRKHLSALNQMKYVAAIRANGSEARQLECDIFQTLEHFLENYESWEMGRLVRHVDSRGAAALDELILFRDEFSLVRDLYQQGFETACKCLWILVAAQNGVKRKDPNDFGADHPASVPRSKHPKTLVQFEKLPNAHKISYVAQVPGWESVGRFLNSGRRNTIGHATARHDLRTGRVVSDKDPEGITYIAFLGETFSVFEALASLMQVLRGVRVAASPDFAYFRKE